MTDREEFKQALVEALLTKVPDSRDSLEVDSLITLLKLVIDRLLEPRRKVELSEFLADIEAFANDAIPGNSSCSREVCDCHGKPKKEDL